MPALKSQGRGNPVSPLLGCDGWKEVDFTLTKLLPMANIKITTAVFISCFIFKSVTTQVWGSCGEGHYWEWNPGPCTR